MKEFTPREIVEHLDKYIVRQDAAKRAIAIAIRNRWRRQQLPDDLRDEVAPKNIIMIGPTGVGKTEIARRIASLARAPFIKVEATKYTEVGYVGRDVESIIRDLMELGVNMVRQEATEQVQPMAEKAAEDRLLGILLPGSGWVGADTTEEEMAESREKMRKKLHAGLLEDREVELDVEDRLQVGLVGAGAQEEMAGLQEMFERFMPTKTRRRRVTIRQARQILTQQEADKLIDREQVIIEATARTENLGIVFLDELDKIAGSDAKYGPDVSRQGVQRDLLPIVEGCTVGTRYGLVRTDHVLFIASGAFTASKPSDLMPELQGRFPIRVELKNLTKGDFVRILTEPKNALIKQQRAMLATEGVLLDFTDDAVEEIAAIAYQTNQSMQNIGARRLYTVLEKLVEHISFNAPDLEEKEIRIDAAYVREQLAEILKDEDVSRYIL